MQKFDARDAMAHTLPGAADSTPRLCTTSRRGRSGRSAGPVHRSCRLWPMTDGGSLLESWTRGEHKSEDGMVRPTYRKGSGPGVVVIHEIPGITPAVIRFAEEVVARGFSVVLPSLFGREEASAT